MSGSIRSGAFSSSMKIAVLGAGAWGTALAIVFARAHDVTLWARDADLYAAMQVTRENRRYLPGCAFPETLAVSTDFVATVTNADLALIATPLSGLRPTLHQLRAVAPALPFIWLCKGLEAGSGLLPHQVAAEEMTGITACGVLSGPSFAEEVARGLPAAVTLASADADFARAMTQALTGQRLRIYANDDVIGVEVGGAVKNVLAIAAGISDGLGLGLNARAALITRGLAEVVRFGQALADITRELGHVAEGVSSAREITRRGAELGVEMPIVEAVCAVLDGRLLLAAAVEQLMRRDPKVE